MPIDPKTTALLLIEYQNDFTSEGGESLVKDLGKGWDSVAPYLRQIGIEDIQTVCAEGMNVPALAIHAIRNGEKAVETLVI